MALHLRVNCPPYIPAIEAVAEGLVRLNVVLMEYAAARGVELPWLYQAGILYRREAPGEEFWQSATDIISMVADRYGDCEDLSAWRAAELRFEGEDEGARVKVVRTRRAFHAIVEYSDGSVEDPSRVCIALEKRRAKRKARR